MKIFLKDGTSVETVDLWGDGWSVDRPPGAQMPALFMEMPLGPERDAWIAEQRKLEAERRAKYG